MFTLPVLVVALGLLSFAVVLFPVRASGHEITEQPYFYDQSLVINMNEMVNIEESEDITRTEKEASFLHLTRLRLTSD